MRIEECRLDLPEGRDRNSPLVAYVKIVLGGEYGRILIQDMRLVRVPQGGVYLQFPTKKVGFPCRNCEVSNPFDAQYCATCGFRVEPGQVSVNAKGKRMLHLDHVYPMDAPTRDRMTKHVLKCFVIQYPEAARIHGLSG